MAFLSNNLIACITAICGGLVFSTFGVTPVMLFILVVAMLFDFMTGVAAAIKRGEEIQSKIMSRKAVRLGLYMITLVSITLLLIFSKELGVHIEDARFIYNTTFTLMFLPEMRSIFENLGSLGIKIPTSVTDLMKNISITKK